MNGSNDITNPSPGSRRSRPQNCLKIFRERNRYFAMDLPPTCGSPGYVQMHRKSGVRTPVSQVQAMIMHSRETGGFNPVLRLHARCPLSTGHCPQYFGTEGST